MATAFLGTLNPQHRIGSGCQWLSLSKGVAVLNTSVAPMLNPFIYSLQNQKVKQAFMDMAKKDYFSEANEMVCYNKLETFCRATLKNI